MTQRQETITFWDDYHAEETAKDWIVQPDETLLESINSRLSATCKSSGKVLEIGCGSSTLARDFFDNYPQHEIVSTDVSEVCIQNNIERDRRFLERSEGRFQYQVLNAIEPTTTGGSAPFAETDELQEFDVILDKGCLDTFLFRSQHKLQEKLVTQLLDNVHRWLKKPHGHYVILTPRSKLKLVRDYCGFQRVIKSTLATSGALDGRSESQETVFQHVCYVKPSYRPGIDRPFPDNDAQISLEQLMTQQCAKCKMPFVDFSDGLQLEDKNQSLCTRRWKGHQVHCDGKRESAKLS